MNMKNTLSYNRGTRRLDSIIVHCSATPEGMDIGAEEIDCWHRQRGFSTIGYHYVVRLDGTVEQGRGLWRTGAHCLGHNVASVGICYVGGVDADGRPKDTRTAVQREALRMLVGTLRRRFGRLPVYGHRDFAPKACPCFDAKAEYAL